MSPPVSWSVLLPLGFTLVAWWASTAGILYLVKLPRHTHRWTMLAGTLALPVLLYAVATAGGESARGPAAAYVAFTAALLVWGWQELAFLLGYVTGPRRLPCPDDISRGRRVALAIEVVLHHELALLVLGVAVFLLSPPDGGRVAWWTFAALWLMRLSAKLNLFLGARNPQEHLLPPHLAYLGSYFRRRPMNRLFPWSIGLSLLAIAILGGAAFGHGASEHDRTALLLVTALVALGALEHGLMMVPTRSARPHILP